MSFASSGISMDGEQSGVRGMHSNFLGGGESGVRGTLCLLSATSSERSDEQFRLRSVFGRGEAFFRRNGFFRDGTVSDGAILPLPFWDVSSVPPLWRLD